MQELINRLARALTQENIVTADNITTQILCRVKYPGKAYKIAFQLKAAIKSVKRTPHHKVDHDTQWFIKTEEEDLVRCLQGQ